jgi:hypothetical protein
MANSSSPISSSSSSSSAENLSSDEEQYADTKRSSSRLRTALKRHMVKSAFDRTPHKFIPKGTIEELVTEKAIRRSLRIHHANLEDKALVDFVYQHARRAFAVTVSCQSNTIRAMRWFKANNIVDDDLPIRQYTDQWKSSWRADFYDEHWKFFAPTFSTTQHSHTLEDPHILPFVARAIEFGRGSFGVVGQYTVHKNHMDPVSMQRTTVIQTPESR